LSVEKLPMDCQYSRRTQKVGCWLPGIWNSQGRGWGWGPKSRTGCTSHQLGTYGSGGIRLFN